jgi:geranylgeranyl reductase
MREIYDVIVVGAGPGGLECANQLKNSSLSVLLIEKNKMIGPKTCAGGLTHLSSNFKIPGEKTRSFTLHKVNLENKKHEIKLINPIRTISRHELGQYQLHEIENARNVKILKDTKVVGIKENKVLTNSGNYYFRYLVGADGLNSIVRRHLGLNSDICIGLYYEIHRITDTCIWYFNPHLLKAGYIWVFPHKTHTNIGIYFNLKHLKSKSAKEILMQYLNDNDYEFSEEGFKGAPVNCSYQGSIFNNIFLVGEAAGLVSKATGEGISLALISGREIGKKILNPEYGMVDLYRALKYKKRQERFLKIYVIFPFFQNVLCKSFLYFMKRGWFQSYIGY